jgi:Uma2 family endonuclease
MGSTETNRRRPDRAVWAGLERLPRKKDKPTILVEFVSSGKRDRIRDYEEKRDEYMALGVQEYWMFDRFQHTMTIFVMRGKRVHKVVLGKNDTYTTPLLPGFELSLANLFALADDWQESEEYEL